MSKTHNTPYENVVLASLWKNRNGYHSLPVDARGYDKLQSALEQGGTFIIRNRTDEAIAKSDDPAKAPTAYLEFIPAAVTERRDAAYKANRDRERGSESGI